MNGFGRGGDKQNKDKVSVITKETVGMTLLLFSALALLITITRSLMLGEVGVAITAFFLGVFGYLTYPLLVLSIYFSLTLVTGKKLIKGKWIGLCSALLAAVFLIVHLATSTRFVGEEGYGAYLSGCWTAGAGGVATSTGGGVIFGLIVYPIRAVLSNAGAYVVFSFLIVLALFFILRACGVIGRVFRKKSGLGREIAAADENEARAYPAAVSFDELTPAPRPTAQYPYANAFDERANLSGAYAREDHTTRNPYSAPSSEQSQTPKTERGMAYDGRSILFADPATSYKNNLIYDRDSYFNSRGRRISVEQSGNTPAPTQTAQPQSAGTSSYVNDYTRQAETPRPAMPKKVTEEKPFVSGGYTYPLRSDADDLNYPQKPSYKAPTPEPKEEHDYYAKDVPFTPAEEEFSSAPNIDDFKLPESPKHPDTELRFGDTPIYSEPKKPLSESAQKEANFRSLFSRPARSETPVEPTQSSRPVEPTRENLRDSFREEPVREQFTEEPVRENLREPFAEEPEEEPPVRDTGRDMFAREEQEELPKRKEISRRVNPLSLSEDEEDDEEDAGESRVFDSPIGRERSAADLFDDDEDEDEEDAPVERFESSRSFDRLSDRGTSRESVSRVSAFTQPSRSEPEPEPAPAPAPVRHVYREYVHPPVDLFRAYDDNITITQEEIEKNSAIIVETLAGFRVDAEVVKVTCGSAVTRYDIDIPRNISVPSVVKRDKEIAMRLHARDGVNVYANWEHGAISIEVPNSKRVTVGMRSLMLSDSFVNAKPNSLMFAIGKDVEGRNLCGDIEKMTHVLIAGSTGSGKSVCLHAMLISMISKYSPEELRLILIDPKKVEFAIYEGIPHLMINEIITDAQKVVAALNWSIKEMERRYELFEQKTRSGVAVRKIDEYNAKRTEDEERLPKIVIVLDELADLMAVAKKDIEERINRLAAKARAAGIHLVIATQRPSVDVITGVIKSNLPTRMALRVIQEVDSRTILDESGAEKLLGNGDMLFSIGGMNKTRAQGAFISSDETQDVIDFIKKHNESYYDTSVADYINKANQSVAGGDDMDDGESEAVSAEYIKALGIVVKLGSASISLIQRKCSVGYNHAGKIIEWMELMGYITPFDGKAKARTVILTKEEYESKYGSLD
ncbi:MAG: hypothetical protein K2L87_01355 [Clostridiales bacterium]|nr:hypothetical protein [Clostridiales bacterium]